MEQDIMILQSDNTKKYLKNLAWVARGLLFILYCISSICMLRCYSNHKYIVTGTMITLMCYAISYFLVYLIFNITKQDYLESSIKVDDERESKLVVFSRNNQPSLEYIVPYSFKILPFFVIWYKTSDNKKEYINFI